MIPDGRVLGERVVWRRPGEPCLYGLATRLRVSPRHAWLRVVTRDGLARWAPADQIRVAR